MPSRTKRNLVPPQTSQVGRWPVCDGPKTDRVDGFVAMSSG